MKRSKKHACNLTALVTLVTLSLLVAGRAKTEHASGPGKAFTFEAGYPTPEASEALYDEMDYQRAVQAYIFTPAA